MSQLKVRELMKTPAVSVHPKTTLNEARDTMRRASVHHLPVVDGSGTLVSMLSERDVERALGLLAVVQGNRATLDVGDICTNEVLRVGPDLPAHEAATMLIESHADGLPVVDGSGRLIGILTATDLVEVARETLLGVAPEQRARA
jgi:acetoin utilization protein AcuB